MFLGFIWFWFWLVLRRYFVRSTFVDTFVIRSYSHLFAIDSFADLDFSDCQAISSSHLVWCQAGPFNTKNSASTNSIAARSSTLNAEQIRYKRCKSLGSG